MWKSSLRAVDDPIYAGPVIGGFLVALIITRSHLVAVVAAAEVGFVGVAVTAGMPNAGGSVALPAMALPAFDFNPSSLMALGLPLLILTVGVGNLQALAILRSEGFPVRCNFFRFVVGAASLVNAVGGGHPAAIGGNSIANSAGPAAGTKECR